MVGSNVVTGKGTNAGAGASPQHCCPLGHCPINALQNKEIKKRNNFKRSKARKKTQVRTGTGTQARSTAHWAIARSMLQNKEIKQETNAARKQERKPCNKKEPQQEPPSITRSDREEDLLLRRKGKPPPTPRHARNGFGAKKNGGNDP
jgi:hypothetical protein